MASKKTPKKFVEKADKKTEEQQIIQATINSNYSLLIPCNDCAFIYVRNPLTQKIKHFDVKSEAFISFVTELFNIGLGEKITKDFEQLAQDIDPRWTDVSNLILSRVNSQE